MFWGMLNNIHFQYLYIKNFITKFLICCIILYHFKKIINFSLLNYYIIYTFENIYIESSRKKKIGILTK